MLAEIVHTGIQQNLHTLQVSIPSGPHEGCAVTAVRVINGVNISTLNSQKEGERQRKREGGSETEKAAESEREKERTYG